ncbi:DHS-like NAD/FAD-binding domain-containing protein [Auriscalpium vulgare]|uniref:DHS-like NAD/FAD-binding domain-containing protein n=1 Tax=Auriscalpium vulgare TaxID=40419 RepID=A0ACB8RT07_9AGAM|nr:DHS-like NAD/FAD-binding domain-containing protein [Auriscalpium vulgare]
MPPSSDIETFQKSLASSTKVIILAGAGLSAASGIATYRGEGGLWLTNNPLELSTPEAFEKDPSRVWRFYHPRRDRCLQAEPNAAHHAIAALALPTTLARVAPSLKPDSAPPLLITQNFDSLSLRALEALPPDVREAAAERVLEMHGSAFVTRCTSCQATRRSYETPLSPALADAAALEDDCVIPVSELPRCGGPQWAGSNRYGRCGGLLRPDVVWFGEIPKHMGEIARQLNWCDLLIVVGTSSLVQPAAGFAKTVKTRGGKVAVFNLGRSSGDEDADFLFLGPCEETLPRALGIES